MKKIFNIWLLLLTAFVLVACTTPEVDTFTVTFESNGGSAVAAVVADDGSTVSQPSAPTKDGFVFIGWFSSSALTTAFDFGSPVTADVTVYAKWLEVALDQFVVSFNSNGGSYVAPVVVQDGETVAQPTAPTRTGYTFVSWSVVGAESTVVYVFTTPVTANITLTAVWSALPPEVDTAATYYTYIGSVENLNPYSETLANSSTLYSLVSDTLYTGDYDWDAAIEAGLAAYEGDFTNTSLLPFNYFPAMATERPVDVNGDGTVWQITLRDDLEFEDGTVINAETFNYSYQQLLDPKQLNARATNLYNTDTLPLENAEAYFKQLSPDKDGLGFVMYTVGTVQYSRENSYYGAVIGQPTWPLYYVDAASPWSSAHLVGPDGAEPYLEDWGGYASYNSEGTTFFLEDEAGGTFMFEDGVLTAPTAGWFLDGIELDVATGDEAYYAGGLPAFMDSEGNYAVVDEDGIPVDGVQTYEQAILVDWDTVGFKVTGELTFELTLTAKKSQWQVMTQLSSAITSVVHPANFESGKIEGGARTTYGTIDNPLVAFGVYELIEWVDGGYFVFQRNDDHYSASDYRIQYLRYDVINDQSVAVNEFRQGRLDLAGVSGEYFQTYKNSPYLKLTPVSLFFRFAFSLDRGKDGDATNDNPIMQYIEFRQAMYYAIDRETFVTDVRAPGIPTHGFLGPVYLSSEQNPFSYRASEAGAANLADLSPDTFGYNPVLAKTLFDQAYAQAVTDGKITDGDVVSVELVMSNAETNIIMANWVKATVEAIFGTDKFELEVSPVTGPELTATDTGIWDTGNFDLTFGGWQGDDFWAPSLLQVYSSGEGANYMLEVGFDTGTAELTANLAYGKVAVTAWLAELEAKETLTTLEEGYVDDFTAFLAGFTGDTYTATYDELIFDVYFGVLDYDLYDGRDVDFDNITAALEGELLAQMIAIPLFTSVSSVVYSNRVIFEAQSFHARMGWGGYQYMYLAQQ